MSTAPTYRASSAKGYTTRPMRTLREPDWLREKSQHMARNTRTLLDILSGKPLPKPRRATFLDLPRELRDQVYGYIVKSDNIIEPFHDGKLKLRAEDAALMLVSKQVRDETTQAFLWSNKFMLTPLTQGWSWVRHGGIIQRWREVFGDNVTHLRHIEFDQDNFAEAKIFMNIKKQIQRTTRYTLRIDGGKAEIVRALGERLYCVCQEQRAISASVDRLGCCDGRVLMEVIHRILQRACTRVEVEQCVTCRRMKQSCA